MCSWQKALDMVPSVLCPWVTVVGVKNGTIPFMLPRMLEKAFSTRGILRTITKCLLTTESTDPRAKTHTTQNDNGHLKSSSGAERHHLRESIDEWRPV